LWLVNDRRRRPANRPITVFVGDYIESTIGAGFVLLTSMGPMVRTIRRT